MGSKRKGFEMARKERDNHNSSRSRESAPRAKMSVAEEVRRAVAGDAGSAVTPRSPKSPSKSPPKTMLPALRAEVLERPRRLRVWRISDFPSLPPLAVAQALSRLTRRGVLVRIAKGEYIVPVDGVRSDALQRMRMYSDRFEHDEPGVGGVQPEIRDPQSRARGPQIFPAGLGAAYSLRLTNQNAAVGTYSTPSASIPSILRRIPKVRVQTRRPEAWKSLERLDGATLELLRDRGRWIEFDEREALGTLARTIREKGRWRRLLAAAPTEPARVRAILGAIAEHVRVGTRAQWEGLRAGLNPLSRFDFGYFRCLPNAERWQCRPWRPVATEDVVRRT